MKIVLNWPGRAADTLDWPDNFTTGEMRLIKNVTGLRPSEMADAIHASDPDVIVAFASVAVRRANPELTDRDIRKDLDALPFEGGIEIVVDEEVGQSPPASGGKSARKKSSGNAADSTPNTTETLA